MIRAAPATAAAGARARGELRIAALAGPPAGRLAGRFHAKAGELAERFAQYHVIHDGDEITTVPTYRGEGQCFG